MDLLGYQIFSKKLDFLNFDQYDRCVINTINPHSFVVSKSDCEFNDALQSSDILLPDGSGIVLAARIINKRKINKIAGADIHEYLLRWGNKRSIKVFYLGAAPKTLELIQKRIQKEYPNIKMASFSPPFKPEFSLEDTQEMILRVNEFHPSILFVGMTAPKQEKWVYLNQDKIEANIIVSIGAVFDFYAGTVKRSSPFWIKLGLEWLPRLLSDPKRLWKRNFVSTPKFLLDVMVAKVKSF